MKLRCIHNSIRLRLKKSDLKNLMETGKVSESIGFSADTTLTFSLELSQAAEQVYAQFQHNQIIIFLPKSTAHTWAESQQVGIEVEQTLGGDEALHLLIEKDFPCLDRENEDKSDTFFELAPENPKAC